MGVHVLKVILKIILTLIFLSINNDNFCNMYSVKEKKC